MISIRESPEDIQKKFKPLNDMMSLDKPTYTQKLIVDAVAVKIFASELYTSS